MVRKMNSWPRSEASRATEILRTIFQPRALSYDIPASWKGVYLFYNPPNNFSRRTYIGRSSIFCGFFSCFLVQTLVRQKKNQTTSKRSSKTCDWSWKTKDNLLQKPVTAKLRSWLTILTTDIKSDNGYPPIIIFRFCIT